MWGICTTADRAWNVSHEDLWPVAVHLIVGCSHRSVATRQSERLKRPTVVLLLRSESTKSEVLAFPFGTG
jgi:hypothetical protein